MKYHEGDLELNVIKFNFHSNRSGDKYCSGALTLASCQLRDGKFGSLDNFLEFVRDAMLTTDIKNMISDADGMLQLDCSVVGLFTGDQHIPSIKFTPVEEGYEGTNNIPAILSANLDRGIKWLKEQQPPF